MAPPPTREEARALEDLHRQRGDAVARAAADSTEDLGGRLLRFYWYYGFALDLSSSIVMLNGEGTVVANGPQQNGYLPHGPNMLSLNDPALPENDIGAKAFNFMRVRKLMRLTYHKLLQRVELAQAPPRRLHEPSWLVDKRRRSAARAKEDWDGMTPNERDLFAQHARGGSPILSVVLPKWRPSLNQLEARSHQRESDELSLLRREEESKLEEVTMKIAAEVQELDHGGASSDPLWAP